MSEEGRITPRSVTSETGPSRRKQETWYTVQPGVTFRTGPEGSDVGDYGGTITESIRIRVAGKKSVHNGIASVYASFEIDGQERTGWFTYDEIKSQNPSKRRRRLSSSKNAVATGPKTEHTHPVLHVAPGTAYYRDLPTDDAINRDKVTWERLEDSENGRDLQIAPSSLDLAGQIVPTPGQKGSYIEVLDTKIQEDGKKITVRRWVPDNRGLEIPRRT